MLVLVDAEVDDTEELAPALVLAGGEADAAEVTVAEVDAGDEEDGDTEALAANEEELMLEATGLVVATEDEATELATTELVKTALEPEELRLTEAPELVAGAVVDAIDELVVVFKRPRLPRNELTKLAAPITYAPSVLFRPQLPDVPLTVEDAEAEADATLAAEETDDANVEVATLEELLADDEDAIEDIEEDAAEELLLARAEDEMLVESEDATLLADAEAKALLDESDDGMLLDDPEDEMLLDDAEEETLLLLETEDATEEALLEAELLEFTELGGLTTAVVAV
ncbi:hypothetical protein LTR16_000534 [Cryomyces antarcticus]|uniref:Uncharacterized protein n=1 Tax=Cryomyces antarcticus TaxID=329879 RepID=A0ABR0MAU7_9PEZI|nr:hypothetical protein LTR16_000534 [Cryomyces antarcticus]